MWVRSLSHAGRLAERAPLSSQCPFSSFKVAFQARGGGHRFWASGPRSGWVWVPPWPLSSCMMWASHSSFLISSFLSGRATCLTPCQVLQTEPASSGVPQKRPVFPCCFFQAQSGSFSQLLTAARAAAGLPQRASPALLPSTPLHAWVSSTSSLESAVPRYLLPGGWEQSPPHCQS